MLPRMLICALMAVAMLVLPSVLPSTIDARPSSAAACDVVVGSRAVVVQARGGYGGGYGGGVFAQDACGHNEVQVLAVRRRRVRQQVVVVQDVHHSRGQQVLVLQDGGGRRGGGGGLINLNFGGRRGR